MVRPLATLVGYVSYCDIREQFKKLQIQATDAEVTKFIELADPNKQGYLDFKSFATVIAADMVDKLTPLPNNEETYLYRRERMNVVPNAAKIQENMTYHKTFTSRFNEIKDRLLPDQNLLLSKAAVLRCRDEAIHAVRRYAGASQYLCEFPAAHLFRDASFRGRKPLVEPAVGEV